MDHAEILSQLEILHSDALGWAVNCAAGDWHRGQDVLQAAYAKALQGTVRFAGRSSFKTWWFGVIRFTALEEARRSRRWLAFLDGWRTQPEAQEAAATPITDDLEFQALAVALRELSERQREVLHLTFYQRLSLSEAAEVMQVSIGSVRQHYERGKKRLREILQAQRAVHE